VGLALGRCAHLFVNGAVTVSVSQHDVEREGRRRKSERKLGLRG